MKKLNLLVLGIFLFSTFSFIGCEGIGNPPEAQIRSNQLENCIEYTLVSTGVHYTPEGYRNVSWTYYPNYPGWANDTRIKISDNGYSWKKGETVYIGLNTEGNWTFSRYNIFTSPLPKGRYWIIVSMHDESFDLTDLIEVK